MFVSSNSSNENFYKFYNKILFASFLYILIQILKKHVQNPFQTLAKQNKTRAYSNSVVYLNFSDVNL